LNKSKGYYSAWGNTPIKLGELVILKTLKELESFLPYKKPIIPVGNFKSYGDCALSDTMVKFDPVKTIQINRQKQTATVSSNVLIGDLIQKTLPMGLFPTVVPGTKFVTIGGAIAADIHGKNHHLDGCFTDHVLSFEVITTEGRTVICSRNKTKELWKLTCGGMGLTGIIKSAELKLIKVNSSMIHQKTIKAKSLDKLFDCFEKNNQDPFSVAWVDCAANNHSIGRGIFMSGKFSDDSRNNLFSVHSTPKFSIPFLLPKYLINSLTIKCFNSLYYRLSENDKKGRQIHYDDFFFPLDKIKNWNRIYGNAGFLQYQFVLPKSSSLAGLKSILSHISNSGQGSPLAVLKLFGRQNKNYLSFPMKGYTLALDFKNTPKVHQLLIELDSIVNDYNGRIYLAKDSRIKRQSFIDGYQTFQIFKNKIKHQKNISSFQSKRLFK
tara:strand:+ start:8672 stop:9982 length:1311 start_codon:yes stop_codon:yes gene_type:complete